MSDLMRNYRYTKDMFRLTDNQRTFYEKNGYLVFPGLIPQDVLDKCHKRYVYCADTKRAHQRRHRSLSGPSCVAED